MNSNQVRIRMAPSPTGFLHIGSARTALYNWLFAKHNNGRFLLRVEDTDIKRSSENMIQVILDGMKWLGLDWDEIYYQSKRLAIYQNYVEKLLEKGFAYYCYCAPKELEKERLDAYKHKINWQYDRRCLRLSTTEREAKENAKIPKAVRFLVPDHSVAFLDIVHSEIRREGKDIEDFVIFRHDNTPTYNFACVVDDHEMEITHVIRGVEHINNTPKQILLYEAFGWQKPQFAHLPLILGKDKSKLSKRHGAVSIMEYQERGFLPEAVFNYTALLGWSPGDNREIMSRKELIQSFTLERINPANAIFDIEKLEWMNQQYILQKEGDEITELLIPYILKLNFITSEQLEQEKKRIRDICHQMQPRIKVLSDIKKSAFFFTEDFPYDEKSLNKHLNEKTLRVVRNFLENLKTLPESDFKAPAIESLLRSFVQDNNIKAKEIIHPLRIFITGSEAGPGLFETLELIGKNRCISRINNIFSRYGK